MNILQAMQWKSRCHRKSKKIRLGISSLWDVNLRPFLDASWRDGSAANDFNFLFRIVQIKRSQNHPVSPNNKTWWPLWDANSKLKRSKLKAPSKTTDFICLINGYAFYATRIAFHVFPYMGRFAFLQNFIGMHISCKS